MKIRALCTVKNESDIIEECLSEASRWADAVYVYDNESSDGTWEKVRALAEVNPRVVCFKQSDRPFTLDMRAEMYNAVAAEAERGDWWCRLDADEFYDEDPRAFLEKVPSPFNVVWSAHFQYYFTDRDRRRYEADPSRYAEGVPVREKCRWYRSNASELRFLRHVKILEWEEGFGGWPRRMGPVFPGRIRVRHYQYRSPEQMQKRIATRSLVRRGGYAGFTYDSVGTWEELAVDAATLRFDDGRAPLVIDEHQLPPHLDPPLKGVLKRLAYGWGFLP